MAVPLTTLRPGDRARVSQRDLCCHECDLLTAMGLTDQCRLTVCRGGAPCVVQVDSTRLALSRAIACRIMVDTETPASAD